MTSPVSRYTKPFTSIQEQVRLLVARGLDIPDEAAAEAALRRHGYYRLSGYSHVYRARNGGTVLDDFVPGASLSDVLEIEHADATLRSLLLDALAVVEVILRFNIGHRLGRRSAFAHRRPQDLGASFTTWKAARPQAGGGLTMSEHMDWLIEYKAQESRSQETFVTHFRSRYGPHLPVWVSTEVMSFGTLSRLYNGMHENDRKLVALRFGLRTKRGEGDSSTFSTWLNHLRYVRNLCAHHGRVWNRNFDIGFGIPDAPELAHLAGTASRRVYGSLAILRYLLARVAPDFTSWFLAVDAALGLEQVKGVTLEQMGFPHGWQMQKIWAPIDETDVELLRIVNSVEAVDVLNTREARQELTVKPDDKARRGWLRYLESKGAVIAHALGPQKYYPAFQFSGGDVRPAVADVNEALFSRLSAEERSLPQGSITVQRWWTTGSEGNGFAEVPMRQLHVDPTVVLAAARSWGGTRAG